MEQLLAHFWGDFVLQTDWMALNKKKPGMHGWIPVLAHSLVYTLMFLMLTRSWVALAVIFVTHAVIDHYSFLSKLIWARNCLSPKWIKRTGRVVEDNFDPNVTWTARNYPWRSCKDNLGFIPERPDFLVWLIFIVIDNTLHLTINYAAIRWL